MDQNRARILIAGENRVMMDYMARILRHSGYRVRCAQGVLGIWRACVEGDFDLLITETIMPCVDSFSLAEQVMENNPRAEVIFTTGFSAVALDRQATLEHGMPITTCAFHLQRLAAQAGRLLAGISASADADRGVRVAGKVIYARFPQKTTAQQGSA